MPHAIGYFQGAWLTLPFITYEIADVAFCIYKFTLRDLGTLGTYGYKEFATVLAFGLLKFPVALFMLGVWIRTKAMPTDCCGDEQVHEEWDKMNDFNDIPKLITALCNIPLLICNLRILANALLAGQSASFSPDDFYNNLVTVLYLSIGFEVIFESGSAIWRMIKAFRACDSCDAVVYRLTELGVLCLAFFSLRIGYDLQIVNSGWAPGLSIVAYFTFGLGFFYATVNLWIDRMTLAKENRHVHRYTGCASNCSSDNLSIMRSFVTTVMVAYLLTAVIMSAIVMGQQIPKSGTTLEACTVGALILSSSFAAVLLVLVTRSCCASAEVQDAPPIPMA